MNAPKLRPMPIGSTIVNRTWPGGRLVKQAEHRRLEHLERRRAAFGGRLDQQVGPGRERPERREVETPAARLPSAGRRPATPRGSEARSSGTVAEADHGRDDPGQRAVGPGGSFQVGQ